MHIRHTALLYNVLRAAMTSITNSSAFSFFFFTEILSYTIYPGEISGRYEKIDTAQAYSPSFQSLCQAKASRQLQVAPMFSRQVGLYQIIPLMHKSI